LTHSRSLYRRSLKLSLDWSVDRRVWRGQAGYIRSLFEANKNISDPRLQKVLFRETEKLLQSWKHPDPYRAPTAPGGLSPRYSLQQEHTSNHYHRKQMGEKLARSHSSLYVSHYTENFSVNIY
ncbi:hypothetical protein N7495_009832, partial [Penicillium taxi]|uniref:uncharacterized protein n=1 Tax=Penicillium taxi TaxID=168475 RepID=UPI0025452C02